MRDPIERQAAIDALWKALFEYEDDTEKQFKESEDLDLGDWMKHRIFVQNMNDIDRQTILNLPSAESDSCYGCKYLGQWENEVEYGYPSPCTRCKRRASDNYELRS